MADNPDNIPDELISMGIIYGPGNPALNDHVDRGQNLSRPSNWATPAILIP